jgi:multidrug resistance efflux pump
LHSRTQRRCAAAQCRLLNEECRTMTRPTANPTETPSSPANLTDLPTVNGHTGNGAPSPVASRLPQPARHWDRRTKILIAGAALLGVTLLSIGYVKLFNPFHKERTDLVTHDVDYDSIELTIVERGTLESANNNDIYCRVKSGARGASSATNIKRLVDDGTLVKKGDLLIELDDAGLQDQLKNQKITVDKAEADKIKAEEDYNIQLSQNESDTKTAETQLELAHIDLKKYQEGDYPQQEKIFKGNIKQAESDVEQQRDRVAWANRMVKKGYLTVTQSQGEQSKLESLQINLSKANEDLRVLTDPVFGTGKRQITFLENDVREKERALDRVKSQSKAKEAQARSARESTKSVYLQNVQQFKEIEDEIVKCKIYAPQDGLVVYYIPEQTRGGGGAQQSIIAQGEPVREGQKLMQIPDLSQMLVNVKVHEALVSRVQLGQPASVRVESFPDKILSGKIALVSTVSSQQDFFSADVKVYTTKVKIRHPPEGLKPGMSAEVTITIGDTLKHVLTVPVQAIVGGAELGKHRKCYVLTPQGPEERDIEVGESNEKMAEIKTGLAKGDRVVLNPSVLVNEKIKTRQPGKSRGAGKADEGKEAAPTTAPAAKELAPAPKPPAAKEGSDNKSKMSAEDRQKQIEAYRQATLEKRKEMLEMVPEQYRDKFKERLKAAGIEVD